MHYDPEQKTVWQARADRVGFRVWQNKNVKEMTDDEIEKAFLGLGAVYGVQYVWGDLNLTTKMMTSKPRFRLKANGECVQIVDGQEYKCLTCR
jgi:hypothetical protein